MKIFTGNVISKSMQKTVTVAVRRVVAHPIYKKRTRLVKKYHVHDEMGAKVGQVVKFVASKPYSKLKKWKIIEVVGEDKTKSNRKTSRSAVDKKEVITEGTEVTENTEKGNTEGTEKKSEGTERKRSKSNKRKKKGVKK